MLLGAFDCRTGKVRDLGRGHPTAPRFPPTDANMEPGHCGAVVHPHARTNRFLRRRVPRGAEAAVRRPPTQTNPDLILARRGTSILVANS